MRNGFAYVVVSFIKIEDVNVLYVVLIVLFGIFLGEVILIVMVRKIVSDVKYILLFFLFFSKRKAVV